MGRYTCHTKRKHLKAASRTNYELPVAKKTKESRRTLASLFLRLKRSARRTSRRCPRIESACDSTSMLLREARLGEDAALLAELG